MGTLYFVVKVEVKLERMLLCIDSVC